MHTQDEAKKLWCPMVRCDGNNRHWGAGSEGSCIAAPISRCIASGCAMWRWGDYEPGVKPQDARRLGYCGLAGRIG